MNIANRIRNELHKNQPQVFSFSKILEYGTKTPLPIYIEKTRGSLMRWNETKNSPFDYGEAPNFINPADNMAWDVIISPSSKPEDTNLLIVGVVRISPTASEIPAPKGNVPGNHKLILGNDGKTIPKDKELITQYFEGNPAFKTPEFFDSVSYKTLVNEEWESSTLGKYHLGTFKDKSQVGIAVGDVARSYFGAKPVKNNLPRTP